jgi:hypothetical protein
MKNKQTIGFLLAAMAIFSLSACGQDTADDSAADAAADAAEDAVEKVEALAETAALERTGSPAGARVFFISPADGDTVTNPVAIEFGIEGMDVVKAGQDQSGSGHHHLIIDAGLPDLSLPIPADEHYVHFGDASTATELTLEPGTHTLQLLLGDYLHIPHDPPVMSATITVVVE